MTLTQRRPGEAPGAPEVDGARWRDVLEARWRERLQELTELCVAFHETGTAALGTVAMRGAAMHGAVQPSLRRLMRRAVSARQALAETDEALRRLTDGTFGSCQDCGAEVPAAILLAAPETRYCARCAAC